MGGVCNHGTVNLNKYETNMEEDNDHIFVVKESQPDHEDKDASFYGKTKVHDKVKGDIRRKKNSLRTQQKEYKNGNVKVVMF